MPAQAKCRWERGSGVHFVRPTEEAFLAGSAEEEKLRFGQWATIGSGFADLHMFGVTWWLRGWIGIEHWNGLRRIEASE